MNSSLAKFRQTLATTNMFGVTGRKGPAALVPGSFLMSLRPDLFEKQVFEEWKAEHLALLPPDEEFG